MTTNKPIHEIRFGSVKATVWANGGDRSFYDFQLTRLYKDGDQWKTTGTFRYRDIVDLLRCAVALDIWVGEQSQASQPTATE